MSRGSLRLRFVDDGDRTGELIAHAASDSFSGAGRAYFSINTIEEFATAIAAFPMTDDARPAISGGFGEINAPLEQEHLGITVYPINSRGYAGVQVRMSTSIQAGDRPESLQSARIEIVTTCEPLARFGRELMAVLHGNIDEAVLLADR